MLAAQEKIRFLLNSKRRIKARLTLKIYFPGISARNMIAFTSLPILIYMCCIIYYKSIAEITGKWACPRTYA